MVIRNSGSDLMGNFGVRKLISSCREALCCKIIAAFNYYLRIYGSDKIRRNEMLRNFVKLCESVPCGTDIRTAKKWIKSVHLTHKRVLLKRILILTISRIFLLFHPVQKLAKWII